MSYSFEREKGRVDCGFPLVPLALAATGSFRKGQEWLTPEKGSRDLIDGGCCTKIVSISELITTQSDQSHAGA